jgi:ribosomal protein L15E
MKTYETSLVAEATITIRCKAKNRKQAQLIAEERAQRIFDNVKTVVFGDVETYIAPHTDDEWKSI